MMLEKMSFIHKNYRLIGLVNSSPEAKFHVKVNKRLQPSNPVFIYSFSSHCEECLCKEIRIEIRSGSLKINTNDSIVLYPTEQSESGKKVVVQSKFIDWFYSNTHELNKTYNAGETLIFKHLIAQGPNYFNYLGKAVYEYEPEIRIRKENKALNSQYVRLMNNV